MEEVVRMSTPPMVFLQHISIQQWQEMPNEDKTKIVEAAKILYRLSNADNNRFDFSNLLTIPQP